MKRKRLIILLSTLMTLIFLSSSSIVLAVNPNYVMLPKKLQGNSGVSNRTYFIDSSASGFTNQIRTAVNSWKSMTSGNTSSAKVGCTQVYSAGSATFVIQAQSNFPANVATSNGYILYYNGSNCVNTPGGNPTSSWTKCYIIVKSTLSASNAQRTICHELGHAFGLSHPDQSLSQPSVMHPSNITNSGKRNSPTSLDASMIEYIY